MTKYIFMTGGVVSGIGKGLNAASIGRILKDRGFSVFMQKFDPYLNVFPGLLNPKQHGEVFVTHDGGETDLDLGHYERFIDEKLTQDSSISAGKIYKNVFQKEEAGEFNGKTVQVIPHVTNEIKSKVYKVAKETQADIIITEIGGTVGDIESLPFIEAIRQINSENAEEDVIFIHTTLIPTIPGSDELKTKPTQHSYKQLMSFGIKPDIFVLRSNQIIEDDIKKKISLFCDIPIEAIVQSENVKLIYEVVSSLRKQGIDKQIMKLLNIEPTIDNHYKWEEMLEKFKHLDHEINIAIIGDFVELEDSYLSTNNALLDAGYNLSTKVNLKFMQANYFNSENMDKLFADIDGLVLPNGEEKTTFREYLEICKYARENNIATLGIGFGQFVMAQEFAQNILGLDIKYFEEVDENKKSNIIICNTNNSRKIGEYEIDILDGKITKEIYSESTISERHKNNKQINPEFLEEFNKAGFKITARDAIDGSIEIVELEDHDFYLGVLFQGQYDSRPTKPHPLFTKFVNIALK